MSDLTEIGLRIVIGAIMIAIIAIPLRIWNGYQCAARWEHSGRESQYGWVSGCLVSDGSGMVPEDRIRVVE